MSGCKFGRRASRAGQGLVVSAVVALVCTLGGCVKQPPKTVPEPPAPLEVPVPPPRVLAPVPLPETPPVEPEPQEEPPRPVRTKPPSKPLTGPTEPRPDAVKPETPAPEPPTEPPLPTPEPTAPVLRTPQTANDAEADRRIKDVLNRASRGLEAIDAARLSSDARAQFDTARRFIGQAADALRARNYMFAAYLADKAETLVRGLVGR